MNRIKQILPLFLVLFRRLEGDHGQFRQPFERLQRGLGEWFAEGDDLEDAHQLLLPHQGQVSDGPDRTQYVDVGVILTRQLAGGEDQRARRLRREAKSGASAAIAGSTIEISSETPRAIQDASRRL